MIIQVIPSYDADHAKELARKAGYIVDDKLRAVRMGEGIGEMDPGHILRVQKGENVIETGEITERPDLEGVFDW